MAGALAIALLGSEYDRGDVPADRFLADWATELQQARSYALDEHHATFATAFNRSYGALTGTNQARLCALSLLPFPFFTQAATLLWAEAGNQTTDEAGEAADAARQQSRGYLRALVDRALIEIDGTYSDGTAAT